MDPNGILQTPHGFIFNAPVLYATCEEHMKACGAQSMREVLTSNPKLLEEILGNKEFLDFVCNQTREQVKAARIQLAELKETVEYSDKVKEEYTRKITSFKDSKERLEQSRNKFDRLAAEKEDNARDALTTEDRLRLLTTRNQCIDHSKRITEQLQNLEDLIKQSKQRMRTMLAELSGYTNADLMSTMQRVIDEMEDDLAWLLSLSTDA